MSYNQLRKGRHSEPGNYYFITATTAERHPWFVELEPARLVVREMRRLHDAGEVESLAWVLMPDHLHWLFVLGQQHPLGRTLNILKGRSARAINHCLGRQGAIWQPAFHDHALRAGEQLKEVARYIVANPLRAGLAGKLADYPHWDAVWLDV
jgi:REP element-mobilizing transposase RayT